MRKVAPVAMPRGTISFWCGQVYSSRGGQFLGSAEVQAMRKNKYEDNTPEGSDTLTEIKKCLQFCLEALS